jgi:hypothetical protein
MRLEQRGGVAFTLMSGDRGDPPDHPVGISVLMAKIAFAAQRRGLSITTRVESDQIKNKLEDLAKIAAVDPAAATRAPDVMLGFVLRRPHPAQDHPQ